MLLSSLSVLILKQLFFSISVNSGRIIVKCYLSKHGALIVINNVSAILYLTVLFVDRTTGGLASILKDSSEVKFSKEEQSLTCCILCTADYSLETTQQVRDTIQKHRYAVRAKGYSLFSNCP